MEFQDSSLNGSKVTVGIKTTVTDAWTHVRTEEPKAICPSNFFKVWDINSKMACHDNTVLLVDILYSISDILYIK